MAGMFSLLNNNRGEANQGVPGNGWDENMQNRATPSNRTPVMTRRSGGEGGGFRKGFNSNPVKMNMGKDRLPKNLRKRRIAWLHPLLRRSVCTIILAGMILLTGFIFLLIDLLMYENWKSVRGLIALVIGIFMTILGMLWYWWSKKKLRKLINKRERAREKKQFQQQKKMENAASTIRHPNIMNLMLQAHRTTQWPEKPINSAYQGEKRSSQPLPVITHESASDTESSSSLLVNKVRNSTNPPLKMQLMKPKDKNLGSRDSAYSELSCFEEGTSSKKYCDE